MFHVNAFLQLVHHAVDTRLQERPTGPSLAPKVLSMLLAYGPTLTFHQGHPCEAPVALSAALLQGAESSKEFEESGLDLIYGF